MNDDVYQGRMVVSSCRRSPGYIMSGSIGECIIEEEKNNSLERLPPARFAIALQAKTLKYPRTPKYR
ncbi:MAG: hypothetical protein F6K48_05405 [Okeania sp. SIO3H1]|uniref:hypothetical protein n=1 Tax=Okeania sp. SIO1I7 TaxID=2607772 RepID=UPI0013C78FDF|nr:hypothetical protein [Okeania sp. SIO1I7]NEN88385.1 hypothetical protein [Okeania sp. SIO3H1]NET24141.1 hypothetical protein [Okeania sp. SIO1I7]